MRVSSQIIDRLGRRPPGGRPSPLGAVLLGIACVAALAPGCQSAAPPRATLVDRQQKLLGESARAAFRNGDYERAADLYEGSLRRAYLRDDAEAIVDAAYNRAASLSRLRRYDEARAALRDARGQGRPTMAEVLLLDASLAQKQGHADEAAALVRAGEAACGTANPMLRARFAIVDARVACDRGDAAAARAARQRATGYADNALFSAQRHDLAGRIALLEQQPARAAGEFDAAVEVYRSAGHYVAMALRLSQAAGAYASADDHAAAANRYLRAGRSAVLLNLPEGPEWLTRAETAAEAASLPDIAEEARRWNADRSR